MATGGKFEAKSLVGLTLDQFEVKAEIARGGMGVVYKGYQPSLDRWVAIKTLPKDLAGDYELVERFRREAKAMAALNHNNIVGCIHSGEASGQHYIAMEYVEGPSVKDLLKSPTIETDKIFDILVQTCDGLEFAHRKGLVHRDIKPANLLYEEKTGCVKIADFGIAHFAKKDEEMLTLTAADVGMGTMNYMAPEQKINAKGVDLRADIYALGVIIYEAFTGKLPLGKFKLPSELNGKLPRILDDIVTKCLSSEPNDRFANCGELRASLLEAKASTHDKSIRRSMRDALDRTLTAISPNRTVSVAVLGCAFLLLLGAMAGLVGFAFLRRSQAKTREALVVELEKCRTAAKAATEGGVSGEAEIKLHDAEAAEKAYAASKDLDEQIAQLKKAVSDYGAVTDAVERAKQQKAAEAGKQLDEVKKRLDLAKTEVGSLADDGFKETAQKALDDARKAADANDAAACEAALKRATDQVSSSHGIDANVKLLDDAVSKLAPEKQDDGKKAVLEVAAARKTGDLKAVNAAVETANAKLKDLGKAADVTAVKDPPAKDPLRDPSKDPPQPTNLRDERKIQPERDDAREARTTAQRVCDDVSGVLLQAVGGDLMKEGIALEREESSATTTDEALGKLAEARKKFTAAREAAAGALRDKVAEKKKAAALAEQYAADEWKRATDFEASATRAERASVVEVRALTGALTAFGDAGAKANGAAAAALDKRKADVQQAYNRAVSRVGEGAPSLEAGTKARQAADGARATNAIAAALKAYDDAIAAFDAADVPTPTSVDAEHMKFRKASTINLPDDELAAIAPCSRGIVVASGSSLKCFSPELRLVCESADGLLPKGVIVNGLCAGESDQVYVALTAERKIIRVTVGEREISLDRTIAEKLAGGIFGLAYDMKNRQLALALKDERSIHLISVDTGELKDKIDLASANGFARSVSFLRDGTLVAVIHNPAPKGKEGSYVESDWTFTLLQFKKEDGKWSQVAKRDGTVSAVAPASGGLIAVDHNGNGKGTLVIWSSGAIETAPVTLIRDGEAAPRLPTWAMALSVSGKYAWILDSPLKDPTTTKGILARRNRLAVYELKN